MIHGELSNTVGYSFGFRVENFLVHFKTSTLVDKAYNALFDKARRGEIDEEVFSVMEHIYRNTEYTVDVVVNAENYTDAMKGLLDEMPFNRVVLIYKPVQITTRLITGDLSYYVDNDPQRLSLVNHKCAITLKQLQNDFQIKAVQHRPFRQNPRRANYNRRK